MVPLTPFRVVDEPITNGELLAVLSARLPELPVVPPAVEMVPNNNKFPPAENVRLAPVPLALVALAKIFPFIVRFPELLTATRPALVPLAVMCKLALVTAVFP